MCHTLNWAFYRLVQLLHFFLLVHWSLEGQIYSQLLIYKSVHAGSSTARGCLDLQEHSELMHQQVCSNLRALAERRLAKASRAFRFPILEQRNCLLLISRSVYTAGGTTRAVLTCDSTALLRAKSPFMLTMIC